jgi:hypothetical protein
MPATREEMLSLAACGNPNIISAGFTEFAARDNIDVVRGQSLPQVSATGDLNRASSAGTITSATMATATITATMTMPLYEGGVIYSQTRQAQQTVGQGRSQRNDARRAAVQLVDQNWAALEAARASMASFTAGAARRADRARRNPGGGADRHPHRARRAGRRTAIVHDPSSAIAKMIKDPFAQAQTFVGFAPHLPEPLLAEALTAAASIDDPFYRIEALAALAPVSSRSLDATWSLVQKHSSPPS